LIIWRDFPLTTAEVHRALSPLHRPTDFSFACLSKWEAAASARDEGGAVTIHTHDVDHPALQQKPDATLACHKPIETCNGC